MLQGGFPIAPLTPSGHPTFGVYPSCFGMFIPRGFPIAPWNPSAVALQARLCVLQGKIITLHSLTPSKRMRPKGCRGRPQSPLRNLSKKFISIRRGCEGVQRATVKPSGIWFEIFLQGNPNLARFQIPLPLTKPVHSPENMLYCP